MYSDLNQYTPDLKDRLYDVESIYQSIANILSTSKGERLFLPEFGADYEDLLFKQMTDETEFEILGVITDAISRWEPRVITLWSQSSIVGDQAANTYRVELWLKIKVSGEVEKLNFNLPRKEADSDRIYLGGIYDTSSISK